MQSFNIGNLSVASMKLVFLGGGNMTRAIATSLIHEGYDAKHITVIDRHAEKRAFFAETLGVSVAVSIDHYSAPFDILVLAIKPQGAEVVCRSLPSHLSISQPLILSVLAGVTVASLEAWLNQPLAIVRAMPNTPAIIQAGATGLFANAYVTQIQKSAIESLMAAMGIFAWVETEALLEVITALSGSGPAYYFYFIECLQQIATDMGLPPILADNFARQTAFGAATLARTSDLSLNDLRAHVTSKKGATDAAIQSMQQQGLKTLLVNAMQACRQRAIELGKLI